jgi:hypothetical protein
VELNDPIAVSDTLALPTSRPLDGCLASQDVWFIRATRLLRSCCTLVVNMESHIPQMREFLLETSDVTMLADPRCPPAPPRCHSSGASCQAGTVIRQRRCPRHIPLGRCDHRDSRFAVMRRGSTRRSTSSAGLALPRRKSVIHARASSCSERYSSSDAAAGTAPGQRAAAVISRRSTSFACARSSALSSGSSHQSRQPPGTPQTGKLRGGSLRGTAQPATLI